MSQDRFPDTNMPGNMNQARYQDMHMTAESQCVDHETAITNVLLAHAYVPFQKLCPTFMPLTALRNGTIFPGLMDVYGWAGRHGLGGE